MRIIDRKLAYKIRWYFCNWTVFLLGIKRVRSGEPILRSGTLFVSNHRSLIDAVVLFSILDHGYVISKAEVKNYPLINTGAILSGVVFVERSNAESRNQVRGVICTLLENNESVLIFPEGTISTFKHTLPFRKGSLEAAMQAGAPVQYCAMEYMNPATDFWWHNHLLKQFFISFSNWNTEVRLHFFDPVQVQDSMTSIQKIESEINDKLKEFQKHWNNKDSDGLFADKI
ncbi:MAG: 1-acyl-sn-glycerol-3-phosphate acyltransferase [Saprospiraceae bacterium]|nr:1-acyl-sn-glycerol-3-phosphate acyltransferase [Saprospiraceae bacterium]